MLVLKHTTVSQIYSIKLRILHRLGTKLNHYYIDVCWANYMYPSPHPNYVHSSYLVTKIKIEGLIWIITCCDVYGVWWTYLGERYVLLCLTAFFSPAGRTTHSSTISCWQVWSGDSWSTSRKGEGDQGPGRCSTSFVDNVLHAYDDH